ncbi:hypothetical protein [Mucilaginibacter sp.]|jgi:hypothetical protein|uniref:HU domain-containing protein n=1 Tax=Mucilaginibacter sp. TaxID=1882438 RepID=UPI002BE43114|nr:hypothetical protein [Mucilaginibacter sp.]HTI58230.1 hypothetical protein [Mucilaginibacter sp.]
MDLAIYINELLGLQGEVNVPGIGIFAQKRVNGYYNEEEGKFYPPQHEIVFNPDSTDDSGLADYISQKKNISPASAKYFIEKYAAGIQQQASSEGAVITGLGQLFYEYSTLTFKADKNAQANDPAFYGLSPVEPYKAADPSVKEEIPAIPDTPGEEQAEEIPVDDVNDEAAADEAPVEEETSDAETVEEEPVDEYEQEERGSGRKWVVILLVVMVLLLTFGVSYQYKPEWFGKKRRVDTTIIINGPPPAPVKKQDTAKSSPVTAQDTTAKTVVTDTFGLRHYDILGGAFRSLPKVNEALKNYATLGLKPRLLKHAAGNYYKITLGTYFNKADAQRAHDSILNITGINKKFIYIQPYIPKKK